MHIIGFSTEDKDYTPQSLDVCVVVQKLLLNCDLAQPSHEHKQRDSMMHTLEILSSEQCFVWLKVKRLWL